MDIHEIIRLGRAGHSQVEISSALGCRRKTVRKYLRWAREQGLLEGEARSAEELHRLLEETLPRQQPPSQTSSVAKYDELIRKMREEDAEIRAIQVRIQETKKVLVSYEALRRYVRRIEPQQPKSYTRVEVEPGQEAQIDFGDAGITLDGQGRRRKTHVFVMTLSHSRHQYAELVYDQTVETWLACHQHAFEFFGGVPKRLVPDNLKAAIVRACFEDPMAQRSYRELAGHYGFLIAPQRPNEPHLKGKVEQGGVHYVKRNFLVAREPEPTAELNEKLRDWCLDIAGERDHGTTHNKPLEVFEAAEKEALLPLPRERYDLGVWKRAKLHRDCHVVFEKSFYSAPCRLVGQTLVLRGGLKTLRIYTDEHELVATHDRATEPGTRRTNLNHYPAEKVAGLIITPEACREKAAEIGPSTLKVVEALLASRPIDQLRNAGRVLALEERHSRQRLERACTRALYFGEPDLRTIRGILRAGKEDEALPGIEPSPPAPRRVYTFARHVGELVSVLNGGRS